MTQNKLSKEQLFSLLLFILENTYFYFRKNPSDLAVGEEGELEVKGMI